MMKNRVESRGSRVEGFVRAALLLLCAMNGGLSTGCSDPSDIDDGFMTTAQPIADWRDEVIYQLLVDRFGDGDQSNDFNVRPGELGRFQGGDWQGVIDHLDYLHTLGVTALWVSPVVRNLETDAGFDAYHGYWQSDMTRPNPHFGDLGALRRLVQAAHDHGMKVILDIVTNHVGQLFYYDINGNGQPDETVYGAGCGVQPPMDSQACPMPAVITHLTEYDPDYDPNGVEGYTSLGFSGPATVRWLYDPGIDRLPPLPGAGAESFADDSGARLFQRRDWYHKKGRITNYGVREQVLTGDFPGGLKDLDTDRDDVTAALTAVFARWIRAADFDGFRIDTLKHVDHPFWKSFCGGIRGYVAGMPLADPTQMDSPSANVPPLTVPKPKFLMFGESFDGDNTLNGSYTVQGEVDSVFHFAQKFSVFDGVFKNGGPTKAIEDQLTTTQMAYGSEPQPGGVGVPPKDTLVNFMDNHDVARFLFDKPSPPALRNALSFLLTEQGIPCIYYGTEQEFQGGNDPTNREVLWQTDYGTSNPTFKHIQRMIQIRKAYAPLRRGDMTVRWSTTHTGNEQDADIFAFERTLDGKTVLVVLNTSDDKTSQTSATTTGGVPMGVSFSPGTQLAEVYSADPAATATVDPGGTLTVSVSARGVKIFVPMSDVVALE
jgi:glycosidase